MLKIENASIAATIKPAATRIILINFIKLYYLDILNNNRFRKGVAK